MLTFTITDKIEDQIRTHSEDLNWSFTFDLQGRMIDGFELAHRLEDEGAALAEWALEAAEGESAAFPSSETLAEMLQADRIDWSRFEERGGSIEEVLLEATLHGDRVLAKRARSALARRR